MSSEKWNKIVDFYNKFKFKSEEDIQKLWEQLFADSDLFGYSKIYNEIEAHRHIKCGSTIRVIPDIIIKKDNKDLFIVELKKSSLDCGDEQLLSYLKLIHNIKFGVLICNKLYIYNFDTNKSDEEQIKIAIDFTYNNPLGIKFVELFTKRNFNVNTIKKFIEGSIKFKKNVLELKNKVNKTFVQNLIKEYCLKNYSENEYQEATKNLEVEINFKNNKIVPSNNRNINNKQLISSNGKLGKSEIFKRLGLNNGTYAVKNKTANIYWANPNIKFLDEEWNLVLEDCTNHKFYHFIIPANSIRKSSIKLKNSKLIDLQIMYNDDNFTDSRSGISFAKWLKETIIY